MVCGWAGSLACADGINLVAGTGSIGYGERQGKAARVGGWGEVFSDEGSAYWIAIQGLNAFTQMSDGRLPKGALHAGFRRHLGLDADLDICAHVMGEHGLERDGIAALAPIVAEAVAAGDPGGDPYPRTGRRRACEHGRGAAQRAWLRRRRSSAPVLVGRGSHQ